MFFLTVAGDFLPSWAMSINAGIGLKLGRSTLQSAGHLTESQNMHTALLASNYL